MRPSRSRSTVCPPRRKGAATVEFAIVAPVFLSLVLGTVEIGNAVNTSNVLRSAVREAGRLASMDFRELLAVNQTANQKVEQDLRNFLVASGLPAEELTIAINHAGGESAGTTFDLEDPDNYLELFEISVTVPYSAVSSFPVEFMDGQTLRAKMVFRRGRTLVVD